jgi:hypothetical protein
MRRVEMALLVAGLIGLAAIVREVGAEAVLDSLAAIAWLLPLLLLGPQLLTQISEAFAWRYAFRRNLLSIRDLFVVRIAGEALNMTTPTASTSTPSNVSMPFHMRGSSCGNPAANTMPSARNSTCASASADFATSSDGTTSLMRTRSRSR